LSCFGGKKLEIFEIIKKVTVNCRNDGASFFVADRIDAIKALLEGTKYSLLYDGKLVKLYGKAPKPGKIRLLSTHIDCVRYKSFFARENGEFFEGIFDNAITNAAAVMAMIKGALPDNVMVAFTGDEEKDCRGAVETVEYLGSHGYELDEAIVADVTFENFDGGSVSVENFFSEPDGFTAAISARIGLPEVTFIKEAMADEAYEYAALGVKAFSLCIPCESLSENKMNMHTGFGLRIKKKSVDEYYRALAGITAL
jgi:hypothetical protein